MALKGIRVIEMAGLAPGPFCGMILADFGASVIRVDKLITGDFDSLGNGKRSIAINLKTQDGLNILKKMIARSDVLIDTYRKGVMEKLKLGPKDVMSLNKRLIYARLSGFGQSGPYAQMAGHDINYLGMSGLLSLFGRYGEKPIFPANLAADFGGGGLMCALGIILALFERVHSQRGQIVDASMVSGSAYLGSWFYRSRSVPGLWEQPRGKNFLDSGAHFYEVYETKDKNYMAVGAVEPQFYAEFIEKLGLTHDELPHMCEFEKGKKKLTQIFKEKTQQEWCDIFDGSSACVTPVLTLESAPAHPHNQSQSNFVEGKGDFMVPAPAPKLSRTPGVSRTTKCANVRSGENTREILKELNFSDDEIERFIEESVVRQLVEVSKL